MTMAQAWAYKLAASVNRGSNIFPFRDMFVVPLTFTKRQHLLSRKI